MELYRSNALYLIISLILLVLTQLSECNNPWLNMCLNDGSKYYFFAPNECQHGIYFRKPIVPDCICGRGVWMFKRDICEPRGKPGYIIAADDERSCFKWKGGNTIMFMRYLGDPFDWKTQTAFMTDKSFSRFLKIGGVGTRTRAGFTNIMIINPKEDQSEIRDCGRTRCFAPERGTFETKCRDKDCDINFVGTAGAVWKKVDNKTGYWFNTEETPETCDVKTNDGKTVKIQHERDFTRVAWGGAHVEAPYGESVAGRCGCDKPIIDNFPPDLNGGIYVDKNGVIYPQILTTTTTTPPTPVNETAQLNSTATGNDTAPAPANTTSDSNTTTTGNTTAAGSNTTRLYTFLDPDQPDPIDPDISYAPNCTYNSTRKYNPLNPKQKNEIREQTIRMMKLHYEVLLNGQRSPDLKTPEYELFQTSRLIMEKVCPQQEVPKTLLRSLLRMFRMVLNETQGDKYPYLMISDPGSIKRLQKSLSSCLNVDSKKQFNFQYSQCPREYTHINITDIPVKALVPCDLQYNTTKFDYVVEAAWKTLMFVHYYCAEYFDKEQYDHSRLQFILQKFFNRNIMHRWFQPGKSASVFEFMFSTYDLKAFKEGMDHCVAGARSVSPYKKWLSRPAYENDCSGEMEGGKKGITVSRKPGLGKHNLVFNKQGVCMRHFDDMEFYSLASTGCFPTLEEPICYEFRDPSTIPSTPIK